MAHSRSSLNVVATDVGGVVVGVHLTVEQHNGNATLPGTLYGRSDGLIFIGGDDKQVDACVGEAVYLGYLPFGVALRTDNVYFYYIII